MPNKLMTTSNARTIARDGNLSSPNVFMPCQLMDIKNLDQTLIMSNIQK